MRSISMYGILIVLVFLNLSGCAPVHPGPEVRPDGVYFTFHAPAAKKVVIAGSFNRWDVHKNVLTCPNKNDVWSIILPLPEGRYEYRFFIDDTAWQLDPGAAWVDDGFGGKNSVIVIGK